MKLSKLFYVNGKKNFRVSSFFVCPIFDFEWFQLRWPQKCKHTFSEVSLQNSSQKKKNKGEWRVREREGERERGREREGWSIVISTWALSIGKVSPRFTPAHLSSLVDHLTLITLSRLDPWGWQQPRGNTLPPPTFFSLEKSLQYKNLQKSLVKLKPSYVQKLFYASLLIVEKKFSGHLIRGLTSIIPIIGCRRIRNLKKRPLQNRSNEVIAR